MAVDVFMSWIEQMSEEYYVTLLYYYKASYK